MTKRFAKPAVPYGYPTPVVDFEFIAFDEGRDRQLPIAVPLGHLKSRVERMRHLVGPIVIDLEGRGLAPSVR